MQLKSLELTGFKSFAKKTALNFNSPITAIVGPNGSGKSNIAEAFSFVLGEQSIKSMRGKKTEDLIFNGSKEVARSNRASAKLLFDNRKRLFNIDYDEVVIERVIYRDSSSEYLINGSQVRLRDILEMLSAGHIGASGHHIISQGEADRILSANLKERRVMIEDALGLKLFQYKKEEAKRKLEKTSENIKQVELVRKEIIPHLKFLKKQVEKVERALLMKQELAGLYREYLKREEIYLKHQRQSIDSDQSAPRERKRRLEKELSEAKDILSKSKNRDGKSDELVNLEQALSKIRKEDEAASRELGRLEGMISSEDRRLKVEEKTLLDIDHQTVSVKEVEMVVNEVGFLLESAEKQADINQARTIFGKIRELFKHFLEKHRVQSSSDILENLKSEINTLRKSQTLAETKKTDCEKQEDRLSRSIADLKLEIEKDKDINRDAEKTVFRIMAEQNEVNALLQAVKSREEKIILEETDFKREVQEGVALVGKEIVSYHDFAVVGDEVAREVRSAQESRRKNIERIKIRLEDAGGGAGEDVLKEYTEVSERDNFLARELEDLEKSAESLKQLIVDLEDQLSTQFKDGITKINHQFQEFFSLMFGGGTASLDLIKPEVTRKPSQGFDELLEIGDMTNLVPEVPEEREEGIDIKVSLPHKKIKGLMMLSGGERALTSIALIFAMSQVNPPPFIILDETDAALDEANSKKYGDMIENLAKCSQLILITHNRETMSRAGVLYGITMGSGGISKMLSVAFDEAVEVAK